MKYRDKLSKYDRMYIAKAQKRQEKFYGVLELLGYVAMIVGFMAIIGFAMWGASLGVYVN